MPTGHSGTAGNHMVCCCPGSQVFSTLSSFCSKLGLRIFPFPGRSQPILHKLPQVELFPALADFFHARPGFAKQKQLWHHVVVSVRRAASAPLCRASVPERSSWGSTSSPGTARGAGGHRSSRVCLGPATPVPAGHRGGLSMEEQGCETCVERTRAKTPEVDHRLHPSWNSTSLGFQPPCLGYREFRASCPQ